MKNKKLMKTIIITLVTIAATILTLSLTSCDKKKKTSNNLAPAEDKEYQLRIQTNTFYTSISLTVNNVNIPVTSANFTYTVKSGDVVKVKDPSSSDSWTFPAHIKNEGKIEDAIYKDGILLIDKNCYCDLDFTATM